MVLLSTLAALVIIVHSAEEEYENQYRRGLRPRALDTVTRRYGPVIADCKIYIYLTFSIS